MCVCVFWHWPRLVIDNIASMCVCVLALASVGYRVCVCVCFGFGWVIIDTIAIVCLCVCVCARAHSEAVFVRYSQKETPGLFSWEFSCNQLAHRESIACNWL